MPFIIADHVPFPNVRTYIVLSIVFHFLSVYFAIKATNDENWKARFTKDERNLTDYTLDISPLINWEFVGINGRVKDVIEFMFRDLVCLGISINTIYCGLVLVGKLLQKFIFGNLRQVEIFNMKEKFWNFVLYKFIFIFGVVKAQYVDEVLIWLAWFSVIGFLQIFIKLSRDRFDYITTVSTSTSIWRHFKIMTLLMAIFAISFAMVLFAAQFAAHSGINIFAFMIAECFLLQVRVVYNIVKYFSDTMNYGIPDHSNLSVTPRVHGRTNVSGGRPGLGGYFTRRMEISGIYYLLLGLDLTDHAIELAHHIHMIVWSNVFLSMASVAICMYLRVLLSEINRKIRKHRSYLSVLKHLEKSYPLATNEELLQNSDNCAICWEKMDTARKLPCGHLFHTGCLQLWLEQDTTCPTCRHSLNVNGRIGRRQRRMRHYFHFDGSRYISWLPSFSVEVMHSSIRRRPNVNNRSQLENSARQVQQIFPNYSLPSLIDNLRQTGSIDITIENILDGRVPIVPESQLMEHLRNVRARSESASSTQIINLRALTNPPGDSTFEDSSNINATFQHPNMHIVPNSNYSQENSTPAQSVSNNPETADNIEEPLVKFYSSSRDRENLLRNRRSHLINSAKSKYLSKKTTSTMSS